MRTDQMFTTGGKEPVLAVSRELAAAKWNVALHDDQREKAIVHTAAEPQAAGRLQAVLARLNGTRRTGLCLPACTSLSVTRPARMRSGSVARYMSMPPSGASLHPDRC